MKPDSRINPLHVFIKGLDEIRWNSSSCWGTVGLRRKITGTQKQEDEIVVRCASLFSQLIALFNRRKFYELVCRHGD